MKIVDRIIKKLPKDSKKLKLLMAGEAAAVVLLIALAAGLSGGSSGGGTAASPAQASPTPTPEPPLVEPEIPAMAPPEKTVRLAYTGDVIGHMGIIYDAMRDGGFSLSHQFEYAGDWIEDADFAICNLETTLAADDYTGYPRFGSPDGLADSLKNDLGFDLVTTANNHCVDRNYDGLVRTLDVLDDIGLPHVGTYRTQEERDENRGVVTADMDGVSIAFLDYTYGTNGIPVRVDGSVNLFNCSGSDDDVELNEELLADDLEYARSLHTDFIIVMMHWGQEYHIKENGDQDEAADFLLAHGADMVLGGHSHVPQPMEYRTVTDIWGHEKTGLVVFSLGNLIADQVDNDTQITAVVNIDLTVGGNEPPRVTDVTYVPLYYLQREDTAREEFLLVDSRALVEDYEGDNTYYFTNSYIYDLVDDSIGRCAELLGEDWEYTS